MRNDIFDIQRYWKYQKHIMKTCWLPISIWAGSILMFYIIVYSGLDFFRVNSGVMLVPIMASVLGLIITSGLMCWRFGNKTKCISEMMTPASNLEKYLSHIVWFVIIPGLMFTASMALCNFTSVILGREAAISSFILLLSLASSIVLALLSIFFKKNAIAIIGFLPLIDLLILRPLNLKINPDATGYDALMISVSVLMLVIGYFLFKKMRLTTKDQTTI